MFYLLVPITKETHQNITWRTLRNCQQWIHCKISGIHMSIFCIYFFRIHILYPVGNLNKTLSDFLFLYLIRLSESYEPIPGHCAQYPVQSGVCGQQSPQSKRASALASALASVLVTKANNPKAIARKKTDFLMMKIQTEWQ